MNIDRLTHWRFRGLFRSRVAGRVVWTVTYIDSDGAFSETRDAADPEAALVRFQLAVEELPLEDKRAA